jgi:hypothetical protein
MPRWFKYALLVAIFLSLGFAQEWVKVNLNWVLDHAVNLPGYDQLTTDEKRSSLEVFRYNAPYDYYYSHGRIPYFESLSVSELSKWKWGLAFMLVCVYGALNVFSAYWLNYKDLVVYIIGITLAALCLVVLLTVIYTYIYTSASLYNVSRELLGFVQSPMPIILVLFGALIRKRMQHDTRSI